jgi:hypothetical protein
MTLQGKLPTIFHITHWKAGSQWIHKILLAIAADRIVRPVLDEKQFLEVPLLDGAVYPTAYVTREQFFSVSLPGNYRKFIIIRDLRDTLVSGYFSIRFSHPAIDDRLTRWRTYLESNTTEAGLMMLMHEWLPSSARIQKSWLDAGERLFRYEELLGRDFEILDDILNGECELNVPSERLRDVIENNRFENLTGGRKPGQEEVTAHERKGVVGDWQNHFTPMVEETFNEQFGQLLVSAGYQLKSGDVR